MSRRLPLTVLVAVGVSACSLGLDWTPAQVATDAATTVDVAAMDGARRDSATDDVMGVGTRCGSGDACPAGLHCCNNICRVCCNNTDCAGNPTGGYCCPNAGYTCRQCCEDNQCTQGGTRNCCNNVCQQRGC